MDVLEQLERKVKLRNGLYVLKHHGWDFLAVYRYPMDFNWELYDMETGNIMGKLFPTLTSMEQVVVNAVTEKAKKS